MNGLLYTHIKSDGTGFGERTDIASEAAAEACREDEVQ